MLDVLIDVDTPVYGKLARMYKKVVGFPVPPVVRGVGLTPIPRPERLYFWFGEPIDTTGFAGHADDTAAARAVRDEVGQSVMAGIQFLRDERERDPHRAFSRRMLGRRE
jgi:hypothetical protein